MPELLDEGYSYNHNGVMQYAKTLGELISRCDPMAALAEQDPEAFDVMLELAASGEAILADKDTAPQPKSEATLKQPKSHKDRVITAVKTAEAVRDSLPVRDDEQIARTDLDQLGKIPHEQFAAPEVVSIVAPTIEQPIVLTEVALQQVETRPNPTAEVRSLLSPIQEVSHAASFTVEIPPRDVVLSAEPDLLGMQLQESAPVLATEQHEAIRHDPTAEVVYQELLAISELEYPPLPLVEVLQQKAAETVELSASVEQSVALDFETFMAGQFEAADPAVLVSKQEPDAMRSLEQAIELLAEVRAIPEYSEVYKCLQALEVAVHARHSLLSAEVAEPQLTIAITEKLLELLKALGYQNTGETLLTFAKHYDIASLLQALSYIYQLHDVHGSRELLRSQMVSTASDVEDSRLRLGKLLFGLIAGLAFTPSNG